VKFRGPAFSGPGDTVKSEVGDMVPLTNGSDTVSEIDRTLADLAGNRDLLNRLRLQGM
jgi:hypothetical protein